MTAADELFPDVLTHLGMNRLADVLLILPHAYRDYRLVESILPSVDEARHLFALTVVSKTLIQNPARRLELVFADATGTQITGNVWGNYAEWDTVDPESPVYIDAVLALYNGWMSLKNIRLIDKRHAGKVMAIYRGKRGKVAGNVVEQLVGQCHPEDRDAAIQAIVEAVGISAEELAPLLGYTSMADWMRQLHFPKTPEQADAAQQAARRMAAMEIIEKGRRIASRVDVPESAIAIEQERIDSLISGLRYALTGDQQRTIAEIVGDLRGPKPMRRLLSGDVGTGKTAAFLIPAIAALKAGANVAIMVPNTLLIDNAVREAREILPGLPIFGHRPGKKILFGHLLVGTHSLVSATRKAGWIPDVLIIDEQHRLGATVRAEMCAPHTNVLEATATAIPRTQALVKHAGMDVSLLEASPVDKTIKTRIVGVQDRERLFNYLKMLVNEAGHQVAFVYPLVTEQSESDKKARKLEAEKKKAEAGKASLLDRIYNHAANESIERAAEKLEKHFPGNIGVMHGKLKAEEKQAILEKMRSRKINVMVASTAIELGITLPAVKALVLVNPETLGLASLHQLRGRLARHGGEGACFVYLPHDVPDTAMQRYEVFAKESSGFKLAQIDLEMRGVGDLGESAEEQSGDAQTVFEGLKISSTELISLLNEA